MKEQTKLMVFFQELHIEPFKMVDFNAYHKTIEKF